uniref:Uncharacterized protein n=1 Tax=viral metagenome TaxID=1070528 RepID=A0A6C0BZP5_9ZZZZ
MQKAKERETKSRNHASSTKLRSSKQTSEGEERDLSPKANKKRRDGPKPKQKKQNITRTADPADDHVQTQRPMGNPNFIVKFNTVMAPTPTEISPSCGGEEKMSA